jgi:hypothetical protein
MSSSLSAATGATPAAVENSLAATGGDPSLSLLDLLHSTGDPFVEGCAAEASTMLHSRRQLEAGQGTIRRAVIERGLNPETVSADDMTEVLGDLQQQLSPEAFLRLLGYSYRPGSRAPLLPRPDGRDDYYEEGSDEEGEGDGDGGGSEESDSSRRRKPKRRASPPPRERFPMADASGRGSVTVREPKMWVEGTAPTGGFELETFQVVYDDWFSIMSGLGKGSGCTFKSRIDSSLVPGIRGNLKLSPEQWDDIDDEELVRKIMKNLNFNHSDYYHSQLDFLTMPQPPPDPLLLASDDVIARSYKLMSNKMLYILDQARKNSVKFRWHNVKSTYKQAIRGYTRLERLLNRKDFKDLDKVVSYTNSKLKKRITVTQEKRHEADILARAAGARSDIQGGKHESSQATLPSRGRGGSHRGRGRGGRGGSGGQLDERSGIDKRHGHRPHGSQADAKSQDEALAKRLSVAYAREDTLPKGRYWHKRTPFCPAEGACSAKFCQGCGWHGSGPHWHDRPKCKAYKHEQFVKEGYFHDKHPDKLNLFTERSASLKVMMGEAPPQTATFAGAHAGFPGAHAGTSANSPCTHCAPAATNVRNA